MFIRVKKRKISTGIVMDFVLVESYRDENGKPRQRYLKHISTMHHSHLEDDYSVIYFYKEVKKRLKEFGLDKETVDDQLLKVSKLINKKPLNILVGEKVYELEIKCGESIKILDDAYKENGGNGISELQTKQIKREYQEKINKLLM